MEDKYKSKKLILEAYNSDWFENEESTDKEESVDLSDMPRLEDDGDIKEGKGLKILTLNKLLTRFRILLAQIKTRK